MTTDRCSLRGCKNPAKCDGWCVGHYLATRDAPYMGPPQCRICTHPSVSSMDRRLLGGESPHDVAEMFGVNKLSTYRHAKRHLGLPAAVRCTVCRHPQADEIDAALDSGMSRRDVEKRFGFSKGYLKHHVTPEHQEYVMTLRLKRLAALKAL